MVYDAMLDRGLKPFVELSFMPALWRAVHRSLLWYRGNTTPPKDFNRWGELVGSLAKHCVDRYGISRVSDWSFEVWIEPNIMFWSGTQADRYAWAAVSIADEAKTVDLLFLSNPCFLRP
jgi:xylan 1,4-beta-xylosidase